MSLNQEHRLEEVFSAAQGLPPLQRAAFLQRACGGDAVLRRQADSQLAAHEQCGILPERRLINIFIISWATNIAVVVEACTSLANPTWIPVRTNILTDGTSYFSDPDWTNYPARLYRLRSQ